jgi:hypothetical protein
MKFLLLRYYMSLLVISRELWWMNQERLELSWGRTVDQKQWQCMDSLVRPPRNSNNRVMRTSHLNPANRQPQQYFQVKTSMPDAVTETHSTACILNLYN